MIPEESDNIIQDIGWLATWRRGGKKNSAGDGMGWLGPNREIGDVYGDDHDYDKKFVCGIYLWNICCHKDFVILVMFTLNKFMWKSCMCIVGGWYAIKMYRCVLSMVELYPYWVL